MGIGIEEKSFRRRCDACLKELEEKKKQALEKDQVSEAEGFQGQINYLKKLIFHRSEMKSRLSAIEAYGVGD